MEAIALLKKDHRTVESLFARFNKLGDGAKKEKKAVVQQIVRELSIHAAIEEALFYPAARKALPENKEDMVLEALEEHHVVKWLLQELEGLSPDHERFDAKVTVLIESVKHHVKEEEESLFPAFEKKISPEERKTLGSALEAAKKVVPTRPHPKAPDAPPGNLLAGIPAALLDKVRDLVGSQAASATIARTKGRLTRSLSMHRVARAPGKTTKAPSSEKRASPKSAR